MVPITISMGASRLVLKHDAVSHIEWGLHTYEREHVPGEVADSIYVGGHERHDLGFAGEIVFVFLVLLFFSGRFGGVRLPWFRSRGRGNVFSNKRLREKDTVQLKAESALDDRCR